MEGSFCKDVVVRFKESKSSKLKLGCCLTGEVHPLDGLSNKLAHFSGYVGMPIEGFKKEIISLLRKIGTRRGHCIKAWGGQGGEEEVNHIFLL